MNARDVRRRELAGWSPVRLRKHLLANPDVWGYADYRRWTKKELIQTVLDVEYPQPRVVTAYVLTPEGEDRIAMTFNTADTAEAVKELFEAVLRSAGVLEVRIEVTS